MKRFLIIGLGSIGRRHTRNLAALYPSATFTFLRRNGTADALISDLNGRMITALDDLDYDLIVLATPSALHIDLLPRLIQSGAALMIEKPIVTTLDDCDAILAALDTAPDAVRVSGFNFRHIASLIQAQQMIANGRLGRIIRASFKAGQWLPDWRPTQDYREVYSGSIALGGGVELDLVHELDVARWFFGELDLKYAIGGQLSQLEIESNDVATMILAPPKGAPIVEVSLDYVSRQRVRRYEIVGELGTLIWDLSGTLELREPNGKTTQIDHAEGGFDVAASYVDMMSRLMDAQTGAWPAHLQSLADGVISSRIAIQARTKGNKQ
ncbi:Gfo/Idh/MocA family protein [Pacificibacter marinus]|uniref:Gfo/Idh/MocA family protein n=1 Tax=Pacificibacter marinus TaxID=658057 RepID=UPI001C0766D7|nr:Gfo/Idh/MocA family oxidoreductase [Pacificibacter marinus]MBU2868066.1 Gfo/Idh/MocA family oxidoreductase [Pacificibacter marinus]